MSRAGDGQHLVLEIAGTSDKITVEWDINYPNQQIEQVRFADGTLWSRQDIVALYEQQSAAALHAKHMIDYAVAASEQMPLTVDHLI